MANQGDGKEGAGKKGDGKGDWHGGKGKNRPEMTGKTMTKLCQFHARGWCQRGTWCTFAHSRSEIGREWVERPHFKIRKMVLCRYYVHGASA